MKREFCLLLLLVFLCGGAFAVEGVSPGSYSVDFESGLEKEFVFDFVLNGMEDVSVQGDLAKYVMLDKDEVFGRSRVVAKLKLSEEAPKAGVNNIWIVAGDVRGLIKVNVPYPDDFVKLDLSVPNINIGENVSGILKASNFGKEYIMVDPVIDVYSNGEIVDSYNLSGGWVEAGGTFDFKFVMNSFEYSAGDYLLVARDKEGVSKGEDILRVGELKLRISDYTRRVGGNVEKFEVEVESLWNSKMKGVYSEVKVIGTDKGFDSSIVSLGAWEKKALVSYFDTSGLKEYVSLNVSVYYDGKVASDVVDVEIARTNWGLIGLGFLGMLVLLWILWRDWKR